MVSSCSLPSPSSWSSSRPGSFCSASGRDLGGIGDVKIHSFPHSLFYDHHMYMADAVYALGIGIERPVEIERSSVRKSELVLAPNARVRLSDYNTVSVR